MPKTSYSLTTAHNITAKTNEAADKQLHKPVACKSKYSLTWASAVSKITAANRFAAAGEERSSRREREGAPTGGGPSPRGILEGLSSSRPSSAEGTPRHAVKISASLTAAAHA